jgi:hypothetical protein
MGQTLTLTLTDRQSLRIAELPEDYQMIGVDRSAPTVRKPTRQIKPHTGKPRRTQPPSVELTLRLQRLEGTTQAVLATLRRSLIEKVQPTRDVLAHEAAIAFGLKDDQQALDVIDDVAQTVGISGLG